MLKYNGKFEKLKDYGFTIKYDSDTGKVCYCKYENRLHLRNHYYEIEVNADTRALTTRASCSASIHDSHCDIEEVFEDLLFDLIKDGLVEKE